MNRYPQRSQSGLTLIEMMVAVTISLLLLAGVVQVFLGNKQTYTIQEASSNVQENGRFGMEFLTRDIRMVGFMGCAGINTVKLTNNVDITKASADVDNTLAQFDGTNAIKGYTYDGTFPAELANYGLAATDVIQGTDILFLQKAAGCAGGDVVCHNNTNTAGKTCPSGSVNSAQYKIADNTECNIQQDDIVLISNCITADVHGVTNNPNGSIHVTIAHAANLNKSPKLSNSYGDGSAIYKMTADVYYIGMGAAGEPALFRRALRLSNFVSEELVDGVYDMDLLYGEDTDADTIPNRYVTSAQVTNWTNVVNVRVTLRTRSRLDNVTQTSQSYSYNGALINDRRLRRDFTFTTMIRNRVQ